MPRGTYPQGITAPCRFISAGYNLGGNAPPVPRVDRLPEGELQRTKTEGIRFVGHDSYFDPPLAATVVAEGFARWSPELRKEFDTNAHNGQIGQLLVKETDLLRIWETHLRPGERVPVHRHVLDYSWIALTGGRVRQHTSDGTTREITLVRGQDLHFHLSRGQYHLYDVKNIGDELLSFLTVEIKGGENEPLDL